MVEKRRDGNGRMRGMAVTPDDLPLLDMRYPHPVLFRGRVFPSAENAFQSARFTDPAMIEKFQYSTPDRAAYLGAVTRADQWPCQEAKYDALQQALEAKFSDPGMRAALLATGMAAITLSNRRHENFAGTCQCSRCRGRGKDAGGRLLSMMRDAAFQERAALS